MRIPLLYYRYVLLLCFPVFHGHAGAAQVQDGFFPAAKTLRFEKKGSLGFRLADPLRHPLYWWPHTLLSYPVDFSEARIKPGELVLELSEPRKVQVPFQLSDVRMKGDFLLFARVNFLSDLPSGASRTFTLKARGDSGTTAPRNRPAYSYSQEDSTLILTAGNVWVRVPASRSGPGIPPGPVMAVSRDGNTWFGESSMQGGRKVVRLETEIAEEGDLFITACIRYTFAGGGSYTAKVRVVNGMDFIELDEQIDGVTGKDSLYFETSWTSLNPTHRQAPNHPYGENTGKPGYDYYKWEKIDQAVLQYPQGIVPGMIGDEIAFRLGPYQPWHADKMLTSATFWNEETHNSIGLFIRDIAKWQDHEYAIWSSSNALSVGYFYKNKLLSWRWPLVTGTRSTAIACYGHRKDVEAADRAWDLREGTRANGTTYKRGIVPMSYVSELQIKYGTLDLNKIKDWELTYPEQGRQPEPLFTEGELKTAEALENDILFNEMTLSLPTTGICQNNGFGPTVSRLFFDRWIDGFNRLRKEMTASQRKRLTAMFLFMAYVHASEDYMPVKNMLAGHPNFLADVKSIPASIAFLFPEHPAVATWAEAFEKTLQLNLRYHTRPAVMPWESSGGRWTENLGCYTFAFLRPVIRAAYLDLLRGGKNRLPGPRMGALSDWLVNALSAPFEGETKAGLSRDKHNWGRVGLGEGPRRVYPAQGAHSQRRTPARIAWLLGSYLQDYSPLTAEYLMHVADPQDDDMDFVRKDEPYDPWKIMFPVKGYNKGTRPPFASNKYTGYGIILRAGVHTKDELSVHMQQIDEGPNYRWGIAGDGGCGVLYFFAGGKSYSHNGKEDAGDRAVADTDVSTNFGVFKNGAFRAIGRNVLSSPMYDLGGGQFAELRSSPAAAGGAWPEYQSRSVMLVGADYFVTYDDVYGEGLKHRFSWFTAKEEAFPHIHMVKGGTMKTDLKTEETQGRWYDGNGDCMAVISHKPGLKVSRQPYGAEVQHESGTRDFLFRSDKPVAYSGERRSFLGQAGFIRVEKGGKVDLFLFKGQQIGAGGIQLQVRGERGISASFKSPERIRGKYKGEKEGTVVLLYENGIPDGLSFYLDGKRQPLATEGKQLILKFPEGGGSWEVTGSLPVPSSPRVIRTEDGPAYTEVFFTEVASATGYRVEVSTDQGETWEEKGISPHSPWRITGLPRDAKIHVRVTAVNAENTGLPSALYPVYVNMRTPRPPAGLKTTVGDDTIRLSWGEVLGVGSYQLYRRIKGSKKYEKIYAGLSREYAEKRQPGVIYEYAVASRNKKGEGRLSYPVNSEPGTWLNWDPKPGERFRRRYNYRQHSEGDPAKEGLYYPAEE